LQALSCSGAFLSTRDDLLTVVGGVKGDRGLFTPWHQLSAPHGLHPDLIASIEGTFQWLQNWLAW